VRTTSSRGYFTTTKDLTGEKSVPEGANPRLTQQVPQMTQQLRRLAQTTARDGALFSQPQPTLSPGHPSASTYPVRTEITFHSDIPAYTSVFRGYAPTSKCIVCA